MSTSFTRSTLRRGHLIEGALLVAYLYTPLGDASLARLLVRVLLVPAIVTTGVLMWKLPALKARARRRSAAVSRA